MLEACDDLYAMLLDSPQYWQASNIHVVKGSQAILQNLIKELLWLRKNSKSEDYVLVYITTHGAHLTDSKGYHGIYHQKTKQMGQTNFL